jgi:hypothetical protein
VRRWLNATKEQTRPQLATAWMPARLPATPEYSTMAFPIDAHASPLPAQPVEPPAAPPPVPDTVDLLRQILEVQREQLAQQRAAAAAHDLGARWRAYIARWQTEFPNLSDSCRKAMPLLERAYARMILELTERLNDEGEGLDNDFTLSDILDRYGMRLAQLGTLLNLVGPLAELGGQTDASA